MRVLSAALALVLVFAALFHGGPQQALACTCNGFTGDESFAAYLSDHSDALAIVRVVSSEPGGDVARGEDVTRGELAVERIISGSPAPTITFESNNLSGCEAYEIDASRYHFLVLRSQRNGAYELNSCSGFAMETTAAARGAEEQDFLNIVVHTKNGETHGLLILAYVAASISVLAALAGIGTKRRGDSAGTA